MLGTHQCLHVPRRSRRVECFFFAKQTGEDVKLWLTLSVTYQIPGNGLVVNASLVLTRYVCHNRKLLVLLAAVKEMPGTGWVTKIELIAKVLHLDES